LFGPDAILTHYKPDSIAREFYTRHPGRFVSPGKTLAYLVLQSRSIHTKAEADSETEDSDDDNNSWSSDESPDPKVEESMSSSFVGLNLSDPE